MLLSHCICQEYCECSGVSIPVLSTRAAELLFSFAVSLLRISSYVVHQCSHCHTRLRTHLHTHTQVVLPRVRDMSPQCHFSTAPQLTDELICAHTALVITQVRRRARMTPIPDDISLADIYAKERFPPDFSGRLLSIYIQSFLFQYIILSRFLRILIIHIKTLSCVSLAIFVLDFLSRPYFSSPLLFAPSRQPTDLPTLVRLNELCRAHNVSFFYAFTGGVHGAVFVDHGDDHKVFDFNGMRACVRGWGVGRERASMNTVY